MEKKETEKQRGYIYRERYREHGFLCNTTQQTIQMPEWFTEEKTDRERERGVTVG